MHLLFSRIRKGDLVMDTDYLDKIVNDNPNIDPTAIERSHQAAKQLADAGIKLGGYHLMPALGGPILKHSGNIARQEINDVQERA